MDFDWLSKEFEEKQKKKNAKAKEKDKKLNNPNTKFVLTKNNKGMGLNQMLKNKPSQNIISKVTPVIIPKNETNKISLKIGESGKFKLELPIDHPNKRFSCYIPNKKHSMEEPKRNSTFFKHPHNIPKMVWNSRGQCDEEIKLLSKINKVRTYWAGTSLLIPNVFRHVSELQDEPQMLFEFLDLSKKELLVQANGQKAISQAGAPHLQRKNKPLEKAKKGSSKKADSTSHFEKLQSQNSAENFLSKIEAKINMKVFSPQKKEIRNNLVEESMKQKDFFSSYNKNENLNKSDPKKNSIIERKIIYKTSLENKETKESLINKNISTLNKKDNLENENLSTSWKNHSLEEFNRNLAQYNLLLEKEEKLKENGILENELVAGMKHIFLANKDSSSNKKQEDQKYLLGNKEEREKKKELLMKDLLKGDPSIGLKTFSDQEKSKFLFKSKKISKKHKPQKPEKPILSQKKSFSPIIERKDSVQLQSKLNSNLVKDINQNVLNEEKVNYRKNTETENILDNSEDQDLEISIHNESFLDFDSHSVLSLEEHKRQLNLTLKKEKKIVN